MDEFVERGRIPIIQEFPNVRKERVVTGRVRIKKQLERDRERVDVPLQEERAFVHRRTVNQVVDRVPEPYRNQHGHLVIPVCEEEVVVQKRLVVREEVVVEIQKREIHEPQEVTLARERLIVEREGGRPDRQRRRF